MNNFRNFYLLVFTILISGCSTSALSSSSYEENTIDKEKYDFACKTAEAYFIFPQNDNNTFYGNNCCYEYNSTIFGSTSLSFQSNIESIFSKQATIFDIAKPDKSNFHLKIDIPFKDTFEGEYYFEEKGISDGNSTFLRTTLKNDLHELYDNYDRVWKIDNQSYYDLDFHFDSFKKMFEYLDYFKTNKNDYGFSLSDDKFSYTIDLYPDHNMISCYAEHVGDKKYFYRTNIYFSFYQTEQTISYYVSSITCERNFFDSMAKQESQGILEEKTFSTFSLNQQFLKTSLKSIDEFVIGEDEETIDFYDVQHETDKNDINIPSSFADAHPVYRYGLHPWYRLWNEQD